MPVLIRQGQLNVTCFNPHIISRAFYTLIKLLLLYMLAAAECYGLLCLIINCRIDSKCWMQYFLLVGIPDRVRGSGRRRSSILRLALRRCGTLRPRYQGKCLLLFVLPQGLLRWCNINYYVVPVIFEKLSILLIITIWQVPMYLSNWNHTALLRLPIWHWGLHCVR